MAIIEAIETVYVEANAAVITFDSIPATYEHLKIIGTGQSDAASATDNVKLTLNGDTGSNYSFHYIGGEGTSEWLGKTAGVAYWLFPYNINGANSASSGSIQMYDTFSCIIYDYANTNKNTSFEGLAQGKGNAAMVGSSAYITQHTGVWDSTVAVTSISFTTNQGDWLRGTEISLYGLKSS